MAIISLNGPWRVKGYAAGTVPADLVLMETGDEDGWLPAQVPGEVHLDLQRAGVIDDPFYGANEAKTQWVHAQDWWFRHTFSLEREQLECDRVELVCQGLDTFAAIFINGQVVATTDNMFRAYRFDARPYLRGGDNEIVIGFHAPHAACHELAAQHGCHRGGFNVQAIVQARKAQYACGWDWGPFLTAIGIWQPIEIDCWSVGRIRDVYVQTQELTDSHAVVDVLIEVDSTEGLPVSVEVGIAPFVGEIAWTSGADFALNGGVETICVTLEIPEPKRWWPRGYGAQDRYRVQVRLQGEGITAYAEAPFGLRTVEIIRERDAGGESFIIAVNGTRIFCKGANWIPGDQFLPRVSAEYYRTNLELAAQAEMNMIRVWGGGIYESDTFYQICDALGLLVWQDFAFACGSYPEYPTMVENVTEEARQAIRRLRNYPSLVLWCGNNENHWYYSPDRGEAGFLYYDEILPQLCGEMDPDAAYWNGSPFGAHPRDANDMATGDRHSWNVWGGANEHDLAYYFDNGRFISEFGMQGPPTLATLEAYIAPEDRKPWSAAMETHEKMWDKHARLYKYMDMHVPISSDFRWWVYGGQVMQCLVLDRAIAHWRALKWHTAGTLIWQLNDCWPVTSWAVVDYCCRPKPCWYALRRLHQPLFVTIQPLIPAEIPSALELQRSQRWSMLDRMVYVVNDLPQAVSGRLNARVMDLLGGISWEQEESLTIGANAAAIPALTIPVSTLDRLDPTRQVLVAEFIADNVASRDIHLLVEPKHLALTEQTLGVEQRDREVTISAAHLALYVAIEAGEGIASDNFFHLLPGESKTITIAGAVPYVRVHSLADLQRKG